MDVMFTTPGKGDDPHGKYFMVVAEAGEWEEIMSDLADASNYTEKGTELFKGLQSWGLEAK